MIINVGSKNEVKISAVKEILSECDQFKDAKIIEVDVESGVYKQPMTIEETIQGAKNRAKNAFLNSQNSNNKCNYSVGIESGIMKVPDTKTGYMAVTACVFYDEKEFYLGLSSGFEYPTIVTESVIKEGLDINQGFLKIGMTHKDNLGAHEGAIGVLTKNRWNRKDNEKYAVRMALIRLENKDLY